jgi:hypothetical protein
MTPHTKIYQQLGHSRAISQLYSQARPTKTPNNSKALQILSTKIPRMHPTNIPLEQTTHPTPHLLDQISLSSDPLSLVYQLKHSCFVYNFNWYELLDRKLSQHITAMNPNTHRLRGGGKNVQTPISYNPLPTINSPTTNQWTPVGNGAISRASSPLSIPWTPPINLPFIGQTNHPIYTLMKQDDLLTIRHYCQGPSPYSVIQSTRQPSVSLSIKDIQQLVSPNSEIYHELIILSAKNTAVHILTLIFYRHWMPKDGGQWSKGSKNTALCK